MTLKDLLEKYDIYKYYNYLFQNLMKIEGLYINETDDYGSSNFPLFQLLYNDYLIGEFVIRNRRIILFKEIHFDLINIDIVQKKLLHEYFYWFKFDERYRKNNEFIINQSNFMYFSEYINIVIKKIDDGFEKLENLLNKEELSIKNAGHLRIGINNYFSFSSLNELLESYEKIYSLIYFLYENDVEKIEKNYNEYSYSVEPQFRCGVSHLSGTTEPPASF